MKGSGHHRRTVLLAMIVGVTETSGFSYLDSLSKKQPLASDPPIRTATPKTSGRYLDLLDGKPAEVAASTEATAVAEETPKEQYNGNNFGPGSPNEAFAAAAATTSGTRNNAVDVAQEESSSTNERDGNERQLTATSAYFLEQYNTKNTFATEAKKKRQRQPPSGSFFEPPTLEDASKMEESLSLSSSQFAVEEASAEDTNEESKTETQKLMERVKEAGTAGVISYALWELGFWALSVPVCAFGYYQYSGHWPDLSDPEDQKKLGAEAFAFVNVARFAVPLRISLALGTTPWINKNIVQRFGKKEVNENEDETK